MTADSLEGFLNATGSPAAKFPTIGTLVKGTVTAAELTQQTDPADGKPKTWDNGEPRMQIVVTLATDERDATIDDDDGTRRLFVKGQMLKTVREAVKAAGVKTIEAGGTLAVKYTGDGEKTNPAYTAPKLYVAQYKAPAPAVDAPGLSADELL